MIDRRPSRRSTVARTWHPGPSSQNEIVQGYYASGIPIPAVGEHVEWTANLRASLPDYVMKQLREAAHREQRTLMSVLLHTLAAHRDPDGRIPFFVRDEDLVNDRRKTPERVR